MTTSEALQKLRRYCAYQERSPFEVYRKLGLLGLPKDRQEEVVASLRIVRDDAGKKLGPNQAHFPPNP